MRRCRRGPEPEELAARASEWTEAWVRRRSEDPAARFVWPRQVNRRLIPPLLAMTEEHCAYCDGWPLDATGQPTIDHFRPKHLFPALAFTWTNLFPSCDRCQGATGGKGPRWHEDALKPDELDYRFDRYFVYVASTGYIEPNPAASTEERRRAAQTIELLGLNHGGRPRERRRVRRDYAAFEERPYRFVFEAG